MLSTLFRMLGLLALFAAPGAYAQSFALDALPAGATLNGVVAAAGEAGGRKALRVALSDQVVRAGVGPGGYGDEPTYVVIPVDFGNGSIEVDVMGRLGPQAPRDVRAFIGVAFRTAADHKSFESVYLRPTNGRKREPGRPRNVRAIQYFAYPDWKFDRLRRDFPDGRYEAGADIADGEWIRLRLEIDGSMVRAFVNDKLELTVSDMRLGPARRGAIGLFVDIGTEGYFANLSVTPR